MRRCVLLVPLVLGTPLVALASDGTLTAEERGEIVDLLVASRAHVEELVANTPADQWATKPGEGRWSVGEVVEHLILSEPVLRGLALGALETPANLEWETVAATTTAQLVANLADRSQKFQAPEMLQPTGELARDEALRRFSGERAVTLDFIRSTSAPLKVHTATGPPGTMNVAQWLALVGAHTQRHAAQIEEVLGQLEGSAEVATTN